MTRELTKEEEAALQKSIPKKPNIHELGGDIYYTCYWVSCGETLTKWFNYCPKCGQKIDWEGVSK